MNDIITVFLIAVAWVLAVVPTVLFWSLVVLAVSLTLSIVVGKAIKHGALE